MEYRLLFTLLVCCQFFFACQPDGPVYSPDLQDQLAAWSRLNLPKRQEDSLLRLVKNSDQMPFPVYAIDGKLLSREEIKKQKINMRLDCFGDAGTGVKAAVFRRASDTEMEAHMQQMDTLHKLHKKTVTDWVGKPVPVFALQDMDGNTVSTERLKGKVTVLNFWFIRCQACVQEMPELNSLVAELGKENVEFVSFTFDSAEETEKFLDDTRFDYRTCPQSQSVFNQFGLGPCPVSMVIDPEGRVVFADLGYESYQNRSYKDLREAIRKTIAASKPKP